MKRRFLSVLVALCFVLVAGTAFAAMKDLAKVSLDMPDGWQVTEQEEGSIIAIIGPADVCSISIVIQPSEGMKSEDLAKAISAQLKGTAPVAGEKGAFTFTSEAGGNGLTTQSMLREKDGVFVLVSVTGQHDKIGDILNSMKSKDPKIQALLE